MSASRLEAKGFFSSLFDFGFTSFITLKFLKLIYMIVVGVILLLALFIFIAGLSEGGVTAVLTFVGVPLVTLFYLITARISMEILALFFRIGENTSLMATALRGGGGSSAQLPQPTYGAPFPGQPTGGRPVAGNQPPGGSQPTFAGPPQQNALHQASPHQATPHQATPHQAPPQQGTPQQGQPPSYGNRPGVEPPSYGTQPTTPYGYTAEPPASPPPASPPPAPPSS